MTAMRATGPVRGDGDEGARSRAPLRRELGLLDTTCLVLGGIVGAGIFFTPRTVARQMPSGVGILLTWGIGGLLALSGAFVFAELGRRYPRTGGQYVFLREAFGRTLAFFYGWNLLAIVGSGSLAVVAGICVFNLDLVLRVFTATPSGPCLPTWGQALVSSALIGFFTFINVRGVRLGVSVHNVVMALKVLSLFILIALGLYWLGSGRGRPILASDAAPLRWDALVPALLGALFSYGGWQNAASVAGEIRDARRTLPRGIVLGTACAIVLYLGINFALLGILGVDGLSAAESPVAEAARRVLGGPGETVVALMIALSTLGITHALLLMTPRVCFAMALDGVFFDVCRKVHPTRATPHVAILLQGAFAIAYTLGAAAVASGRGVPLFVVMDDLLGGLVFVDWIFFSMVGVAFFLLCGSRQTSGDVSREVDGAEAGVGSSEDAVAIVEQGEGGAAGPPAVSASLPRPAAYVTLLAVIYLALSLIVVLRTVTDPRAHSRVVALPAVLLLIGAGILIWRNTRRLKGASK